MKKLLGILVALATLGLASPAFACGGSACECDKKAKQAACDGKKAKKEDSAKSCDHAKSKQADNSDATADTKAKFLVSGMTCGRCASTIASTFEGIEGVTDAAVSHKDGQATVKFDSDKVDAKTLAETVNSAHEGKFTAEIVKQSPLKS